MTFVKVVKTKSYFKRFQVKFRRRREGKTDYRARKRLITQDKNKYNCAKYRLIVRITNKKVVCQVACSKISGDVCLASAYSSELPRYGVKLGLTNYAACYATGLLVARRLLNKIGLADKYKGNAEVTGEDYNVEALGEGPRPFLALLDTGLKRTSLGARIFASMKGACDGGINVPHSETRFVGYSPEKKELDAKVLRKYIFGGHVADYMKLLEAEDPERYKRQFSRYIKAGVKAADLEKIYSGAHAAIRKDPAHKPAGGKPYRPVKKAKLSLEQRKDRSRQRIRTQKNVPFFENHNFRQ
jgi:large subunit ribosomal protein L5e